MNSLQQVTGINIPVPELELTFYQPKIKDIAIFGEEEYFQLVQTLTVDKSLVDESQRHLVTNWMLLNEIIRQQSGLTQKLLNLISLLLPAAEAIEFQKDGLSMVFNGQPMILKPEKFEIFQKVVHQVSGLSALAGDKEEFRPASKDAAKIVEKIKAGRKRLNKQREGKSKSVLPTYCLGVSLLTANSFEDISNMTLYQLFKLIEKGLAREAYDADLRARMAGADIKTKLVHWLFSSDEKDESSEISSSITVI